MSTDIAQRDEADEQALVAANEVAQQIAAAQQEQYQDEPLQTPILKIGQGLTREVSEGDAEVGEFINTLTGNSLGTTCDFIVAFFQRGRFASTKEGRAFTAIEEDIIPASWEPLVGPDYVGTPFAEYPEAEEKFKEAANAGDREWGNGPQVSTTWNYTGLVLVPDEEDQEAVDYQPARLSLKRIDKAGHRKLQTLLRAVLRNKASWDGVIRLETHGRDFGRNTAYTLDPTKVRIVRKTDPTEKLLAAEVAQAVVQGRTHSADAEAALADKPVAPKDDDDSLSVG